MAELLRYAVGSSRRTACEQKAATYASVSMRLLSSGIPAFASFLLPEAGPRSGSVKKAPDEHTEEAQDRNSQVHCADQSRDLESQEGDSQRKRVFDEVEIDIPIFELPAEFVQRFELLFSAFGKNDPTAESYACAIIEGERLRRLGETDPTVMQTAAPPGRQTAAPPVRQTAAPTGRQRAAPTNRTSPPSPTRARRLVKG